VGVKMAMKIMAANTPRNRRRTGEAIFVFLECVHYYLC
jgi:hypothetical protein